jgi:hypothetical protein
MAATTFPLDGSEWAMLREARFDESLDDLPALQRIFDEKVFDESQEDDFRAVASAFGNVVAKVLAFEWVGEGDGRGGRQPALQLKSTKALVVQPQKMVLDRIRRGDEVDLHQLIEDIKAQVAKTKLLPKKLG